MTLSLVFATWTNGQSFSSFRSSSRQYFLTIFWCHSSSKSVGCFSSFFTWLIGPFHKFSIFTTRLNVF
jgi:hypothetical protein